MSRIIFAYAALAVLAVAPAQAQSISGNKGYLRSTIETWSESERRPIILFLEESRTVADRFVAALAGGEWDIAEGLFSADQQKAYGDQFRPALETASRTYGQIAEYQYRGQALMLPAQAALTDVSSFQAQTFFAVATDPLYDRDIFLFVNLAQFPEGIRIFNIQFQTYQDKVPPWLLRQ